VSGDDDIEAIRTSLALDERKEEEVHRAGERLVGEIEGWVERFYVRLVGDPAAMRILHDEGRIVRLKRSLAAWFAELFALPFDRAYQRAREQIGRTHVRIGMPQHLMVTAMNGIRRDVTESISRIWEGDAVGARRAADAVGRALDLELALMLAAYGRRSREVWQRAERSLVAGHLRHRLHGASREAVDAARCYAELARRASSDEERNGWSVRLGDVLQRLARATGPTPPPESDRGRVSLRHVCERATAAVSLPPRTSLDLAVEPPDLEGFLRGDTLEMALQDLVQDAVNRGAGGAVRVTVRGDSDAIRVDIVESGSAWPEEARHDDPQGAPSGLGYAEQVARLHGGALERFREADGSSVVRMRLPGALRADRD
jgi:hypothetical protein